MMMLLFYKANLMNFTNGLSNGNVLSISNKKTNIMLISLHNNASNGFRFYIGGSPVNTVDKMKDLGVTVDSRLRFTMHINQIVARAFVRANLLYKFLLRETRPHLYMLL
jgi:hypothetical protein